MAEQSPKRNAPEQEQEEVVVNNNKQQKIEKEEEEEHAPSDWKTNPATAVSEVAFMQFENGKKTLQVVDMQTKSFFFKLSYECICASERHFSDPSDIHMENYKKRTLQSWKRHPSIMFLELRNYYKSLNEEDYPEKLKNFVNRCTSIAAPYGVLATDAPSRLAYLLTYQPKEKMEDILAEKDSEYCYDEDDDKSSSSSSSSSSDDEEESEDEEEREESEDEEDEEEESEDEEDDEEGEDFAVAIGAFDKDKLTRARVNNLSLGTGVLVDLANSRGSDKRSLATPFPQGDKEDKKQ